MTRHRRQLMARVKADELQAYARMLRLATGDRVAAPTRQWTNSVDRRFRRLAIRITGDYTNDRMDLLEITLPDLRLRIDAEPPDFFDQCEVIARANGWQIDRRREFAGRGCDQLNLHLAAAAPGYPMLRMVTTPALGRHLRLDVVDHWKTLPIDYDEYLATARDSYSTLLKIYNTAHGTRYRLGVPRRPDAIDFTTLDCNRIGYAAEKFNGFSRTLAVHPGDARDRLISAFSTFHVIRPVDLPQPLRKHLEWIHRQITARPARSRLEGSVEATVRTMRNVTAARVLARLVDLADAIARLDEECSRRPAGARYYPDHTG